MYECLLVGKEKFKDVCSKRMLIDIETNEEFCPQCRSVEKEDQKLAIETLAIKKKNEIIHLYDSFADNSLINDKLKKATFENYLPTKKNWLMRKKRLWILLLHSIEKNQQA